MDIELPAEIFKRILDYCDPHTLTLARRVSRAWKQAIEEWFPSTVTAGRFFRGDVQKQEIVEQNSPDRFKVLPIGETGQLLVARCSQKENVSLSIWDLDTNVSRLLVQETDVRGFDPLDNCFVSKIDDKWMVGLYTLSTLLLCDLTNRKITHAYPPLEIVFCSGSDTLSPDHLVKRKGELALLAHNNETVALYMLPSSQASCCFWASKSRDCIGSRAPKDLQDHLMDQPQAMQTGDKWYSVIIVNKKYTSSYNISVWDLDDQHRLSSSEIEQLDLGKSRYLSPNLFPINGQLCVLIKELIGCIIYSAHSNQVLREFSAALSPLQVHGRWYGISQESCVWQLDSGRQVGRIDNDCNGLNMVLLGCGIDRHGRPFSIVYSKNRSRVELWRAPPPDPTSQ